MERQTDLLRQAQEGPARTATWRDLTLVLLLVGAVMTIAAMAPSNTYAYAQLQQVGAVVGTIEGGSLQDLLLPRDQFGGYARKPQLYAWLDAPILMLTGAYNDFTFRLPTILASFLTAVCVYFLGRRWYGRRTGLLAACLWATMLDMRNMTYIAITDMMVSLCILGSIMCADKLLFHRAPRDKRLRWVIGLWVTMILGGMSKGWGVLNLGLVGLTLALAVTLRPGFKALRRSENLGAKLALLARLIGRRWWRAMKAVHFGWGMAAMAAALAPVWIGMFLIGGDEFWKIVDYEFIKRVTGRGGHTPHDNSIPAILQLLWYGIPATAMMVVACLLVRFRRLFNWRSATSLPLCFVLGILLPFSLTFAFRPDYVLPCFAAVALLAAWGVEEVLRRGPAGDRTVQFCRHAIAAAPVLIAVALILLPAAYLFHDHMPRLVTKNLRLPSLVPATTWWIVGGLIPLGAVLLALSIRWSLRWQLRRVAAVAVIGMLGIIFVERNMFSRHARTRDGEKMIAFAREAAPLIGDEPFAVKRMQKLAVELYLGRFGQQTTTIRKLNKSDAKWLLTCDRGLIELGARRDLPQEGNGDKPVTLADLVKQVRPTDLGKVELEGPPVVTQKWGRMYLIRLRDRPIEPSGTPRGTRHQSGRQD